MGLCLKLSLLLAALAVPAFYLFLNDSLSSYDDVADFIPKKVYFGPGKRPENEDKR